MQKWEYKIISRQMDMSDVDPAMLGPDYGPDYEWQDILDDKDTTKYTDEIRRLSQLGDEGWELVSVLHQQSNRRYTYTYYLKRAKEHVSSEGKADDKAW